MHDDLKTETQYTPSLRETIDRANIPDDMRPSATGRGLARRGLRKSLPPRLGLFNLSFGRFQDGTVCDNKREPMATDKLGFQT